MPRYGFLAFFTAILVAGCGSGLQPSIQSQRAAESTESAAVASAATTVPFFQSSFAFNGKTYTYRMVGKNPALKSTVVIPAEIVPVKLIFSDGTMFDPTAVVGGLRTSPVFTNAPFISGTTQYGDAQMRGEFWKTVANSNYHVLLGAPTVLPMVTERVPSTSGFVMNVNGIKQGRVTFSWFINTIEPQLIQHFGIRPTTLAFFSTLNTRVLESGSTTRTFGGYHDSFHLTTSSGAGIFGTIWGAMFSSNTHDVTHVGHEVAEWLNDPFYPSSPNMVPAWKHPQTHLCNGSLLEVGDPVATELFTINGYTFEDAVFLSWFSRAVPSSGIRGQYDLRNLLKSPAVSC
jgi:hypothetical protein